MNVVHRDLKPENFLFKEQGRHQLKAIDFGLSSFFLENKALQDLVGSPFYMAPEVRDRPSGEAAEAAWVKSGPLLQCGACRRSSHGNSRWGMCHAVQKSSR